MPLSPLTDTHCHLTAPRFDADRAAVIARAAAAGVDWCLVIGTGPEDGHAACELAARHPAQLAAAVGLDPFTAHEAGDGWREACAHIEDLVKEGAVVGLGEFGLDYHYDLDPRPVQIARVHHQLDLARRHRLPAILHVRDAHADMLALLAEHAPGHGVVHSCTADAATAERYLALGWHLSFNGIVTFKNASTIREAARITPDDRLLLETDAPYLAPVPRRGKRCEPADVVHTACFLADLRGQDLDRLARITSANARALFASQQDAQ